MNSVQNHFYRHIVFLNIALVLTGCSASRNAVPVMLQEKAEIPGFGFIRFHGDLSRNEMANLLNKWAASSTPKPASGEFTALSLSGGGASGAFGAGFLNGWSRSGKRPAFTLVTGISTGALIAPFAFLGPGYDALLKMLYTTYSTEKLVGYTPTRLSLLNTDPLRAALKQFITKSVISAIAVQHRKGRRLIIGTTNLDEMRPVYWDIGAIAQYDTEEARQLIRDVILASTAVPVAFPPVYFTVRADGKTYDEMHVDGGITNQVFSYPPSLHIDQALDQVGHFNKITLYVLRNELLATPGKQVEPGVLDIAERSMDGLIRNQGVGDIYRIYYTAKRDGVDFNLAFVPSSFDEKPQELFDPAYMKKLFRLGYEKALSETPWCKEPPDGLEEK